MAKKKMIHFSNSNQYVNIYPSDIQSALKMNSDMCIQTPWSKNIRGTVTPIYEGADIEKLKGYKLFFMRGDDTIDIEIKPNEAFTVFTGKSFNIRMIRIPRFLRDRVPFALSMNKAKKIGSLEALEKIYKDQMLFHDEAILNNITDNDRGYIPMKFDFGNFHAVVISDSFGQYHIEDGFHYFEGFPTTEEVMDILNMIPKSMTDIRRVEWVKSSILELENTHSENIKE